MNDMDGGYLIPKYIEKPISKWQAFKQRYFPFWLKRIFPVETYRTSLLPFILEEHAKAEIKRHAIS